MSVAWSILRANGDSPTFTQAGIRDVARRLVNQDIDTCAVSLGYADIRQRDPWLPNETISIYRDAVQWFRGRNVAAGPGASGSAVRLINTLAGPWWHLANLIYTQPVPFVTTATANPVPAGAALASTDFTTTTKTSATIFLGDDQIGHKVDSRSVILDALNFAIAKGAPLQIGTVDAGIFIPLEEVRAASCAEVIRRALRWTPGQVPFFDYSTTPPTLHIRTRANRTLVTIDVADEQVEEIELAERRDLQLSGVRIEYLRTHERANYRFRTLDIDEAGPDPTGFGGLVMPVELYGSYLSGTDLVAAEPVPAGLAALIYAAYSTAPFEGRVKLVKPEISNAHWTAKTLRVAGGNPAWETMTADIQSSLETITNGRVELSIGPPLHLGPADLVALARNGRTKAPSLSDAFVQQGGGSPAASVIPPSGVADPRISWGPEGQPDVILHFHRLSTDAPPLGTNLTADDATIYDFGGSVVGAGSVGSTEGDVVIVNNVRFGRGRTVYDIVQAHYNLGFRPHTHWQVYLKADGTFDHATSTLIDY